MYLITVKTLENKILTFRVETYHIENNMVVFEDKAKFEKRFPTNNCQIEETRQEGEYQ